MLAYRRLLTIMFTWQSSCVIADYNQKTSEIYLFKHVIYFEADVKKHTRKNIVSVIDSAIIDVPMHFSGFFHVKPTLRWILDT